jgi:predicted CopG family antitoxin
MATISIDDDVYKELLKLKGNKSISEFIRELLEERKRKKLRCVYDCIWFKE